ncbi:MAG: GxxExxY protein [bacterium]
MVSALPPPEHGNPPNPQQPTSDPRTEAIIGAAIEVQRELGTGYLEKVYHLALEIELAARRIPFQSEVEIPVWYKGERLAATYRADFVCYGDVVVELKAIVQAGRIEQAQLVHYLVAGRKPIGLLLNFGGSPLQIRRAVGPAHFQARPLPS